MIFELALSILIAAFAHAEVRFNHIQALGTHNSYHKKSFTGDFVPSWNFTIPSLADQLDHGVRQIELDIHLKDDGSFFVHHIAGLDQGTHCKRLSECLFEIRAWSDAHPRHVPLMIWVEIKDKDFDRHLKKWIKIAPHFAQLDAEILAVLPREKLFTPELVDGGTNNLPVAIRNNGWPLLDDLRGKIVLGMIGSPEDYAAYFGEPVDLRGKLFFPNMRKDRVSPLAAIFKIDDAIANAEYIKGLVQDGFIVTSMSDKPGSSDEQNFKRAKMTLATNAHYISTNFIAYGSKHYQIVYVPGPRGGHSSRLVPRNYWMNYFAKPRCRPDLSPAFCQEVE